jgi:hypothetical protein
MAPLALQRPHMLVGCPYRNALMGHDLTVARHPTRVSQPAWMKASTCAYFSLNPLMFPSLHTCPCVAEYINNLLI